VIKGKMWKTGRGVGNTTKEGGEGEEKGRGGREKVTFRLCRFQVDLGDTSQEVEDLVDVAADVEEAYRKDAFQEGRHQVVAVVAVLELVRRGHPKHFRHFLHFLLLDLLIRSLEIAEVGESWQVER